MASAIPRRLRDGPTDTMAPKARALATLAAAGISVPDGWVVPCAAQSTPASLMPLLGPLLSRGCVAVRSAGADEDGLVHSGAGLGASVLNVTTEDDVVRALSVVAPTGAAIIQHQIRGRWLVVAAVTEFGVEIDAHDATVGLDARALSGEMTPAWSGRLARWGDRAAGALSATIGAAVQAGRAGGLRSVHGWDLELVVDDDVIWVVQLRPLTAALHPGWSEFAAAVAQEQGLAEPDFGPHVLTLDAEHNPAVLSVAHSWVIGKLAADRGVAAGSPKVLAGWLFVGTLPRDLGEPETAAGRPALPAVDAVTRLVDEYLPNARTRLDAVDAAARGDATPALVGEAVAAAWAAFLAMIDVYVGVLVPARKAAGPVTADADPDDPFTLRERARYLDVLPTTWDIASPTLAEVGVTLPVPLLPPAPPQGSAAAATVLSEWDDHLFALGMAPLRSVFRWVGAQVGVGDDIFLLRGDELAEAAAGRCPALAARRSAQALRQGLRPPRKIDAGYPVAAGEVGLHRGIPVGASFSGPATIRSDLRALLADPPPRGAVVMMLALTAPAAVALRQVGVIAVCSEHGGPLSHATLMARELGLSALIGCRGCTAVPEGALVEIDTVAGRLITRPGDR